MRALHFVKGRLLICQAILVCNVPPYLSFEQKKTFRNKSER